MEVDDMGTGGMTGSVGALLGFGAKKTKYVLCLVLLYGVWRVTFTLSCLDHRRPVEVLVALVACSARGTGHNLSLTLPTLLMTLPCSLVLNCSCKFYFFLRRSTISGA